MKCKSIQQFAIVRSDSASAFEEELNARIMELSDKNPIVKFDGLTAYISYTEAVKIPEDVYDEYELKGVKFRCEDCPMFEPILKEDGTEDKRVRYGNCEFSKYGRTMKDAEACDQLFTMIQNGRVGLCFRK